MPSGPLSCDVLVVDGVRQRQSWRRTVASSRGAPSRRCARRRHGRQLHVDDKRIETYCGRIEESFGRDPTLLLAEEEDNSSPSRFATATANPWAELKARARAAQRLFDLPLEECLADLAGATPTRRSF